MTAVTVLPTEQLWSARLWEHLLAEAQCAFPSVLDLPPGPPSPPVPAERRPRVEAGR